MGQINKRATVLCILDGWGAKKSDYGNAIHKGKTPFFDRLEKDYPPILLNASSEFVGLPQGQMGNSEVGHLNIGAGRVVLQDLPKINKSIKDGDFFTNPIITEGMKKSIDNNSNYHLFGLLSDGGVHSHIDHLIALLKKAKADGLREVYLHLAMDGRDTPPDSGINYLVSLLKSTKEIGIGRVATISGRYWIMDRDNRWERIEKAFNAMVHGKAEVRATDPIEAVKQSYANGKTDEFIEPTVMVDESGNPIAPLKKNDTIQFFNFRADRVREIATAITQKDFTQFPRGDIPNLNVYCMTSYASSFNLPLAFEKESQKNGLGEIISSLGMKQFRTAETEKYAHVTYFFNGGIETPLDNESRVLVPSPSVSTYDLKPEMSAYEVTDLVTSAVNSGNHDLIVVNLANGDMVGHTGLFPAALKAVETVDRCVQKIFGAVKNSGGQMIVTADHGNIEEMLTNDDKPITSHSTNLVPFYAIAFGMAKVNLNQNGGSLCDIAPTLLSMMKINQPDEMTGSSLIVK